MAAAGLLASRRVMSRPLTYARRRMPTDLDNLELWLSADSVSGVSDGNTIATWTDSSAQGNDYSQSSESLKPTYQTNELGGLPIVRFDGTDDGMTGAAALTLPCSVLYVAKHNTASGTRRLVQGAVNNWLMGPYNNYWQTYDGGAFRRPLESNAFEIGWVFHCSVMVSGTLTSYLIPFADGQFWARKVDYGTTSTNPGTLALGASGAYSESANSDVGEIAAFTDALTESEVHAIFHGFRDKYFGPAT